MSLLDSIKRLLDIREKDRNQERFKVIPYDITRKTGECNEEVSDSSWVEFEDPESGELRKGLMKFSYDSEIMNEKVACEMAKILPIRCAEYDLVEGEKGFGVVSYDCRKENQNLVHGSAIIVRDENLAEAHSKKQISDEHYEIVRVINSLQKIDVDNSLGLKKDYLNMVIFDCLTGNSDRHCNNWGLIEEETRDEQSGQIKKQFKGFAPIFDQGRCFNTNEGNIRLGDPNVPYKNVVQFVCANYYEETKDLVKEIEESLTNEKLDTIFQGFSKNFSSNVRLFDYNKNKIKEIVSERKEYICEMYKEKSYAEKFINSGKEKKAKEVSRDFRQQPERHFGRNDSTWNGETLPLIKSFSSAKENLNRLNKRNQFLEK